MDILKSARAGTLESNDCLIEISPAEKLEILVESPVYDQFKEQIDKVIDEALKENEITKANIHMEDRGALDCTIRARLRTAIRRANEED